MDIGRVEFSPEKEPAYLSFGMHVSFLLHAPITFQDAKEYMEHTAEVKRDLPSIMAYLARMRKLYADEMSKVSG